MNYVVAPSGVVHAVGATPRLSPGYSHHGAYWSGPSRNPAAGHRRGTLAGQLAPMQAPTTGFSFGTVLLVAAGAFVAGALVGGYFAWSACLGKAAVAAAVPAIIPHLPHLLGSGTAPESAA